MSCEKVALLYLGSQSQWRLGVAVNVCPDSISDQINLIWWCIIMSQRILWKYSFAIFKVKATIIFTMSSEILKLLQPRLVWWSSQDRARHSEKILLLLLRAWDGLGNCGLDCCQSWPYLKQGSVLVPIKKMWTEHCFCNEYTCLLNSLVNGSSVWLLYPFVLVVVST